MFVCSIEGGCALGMPDVCRSAGSALLVCVNRAECRQAAPGSFAGQVHVNGVPALHLGSTLAMSRGDEAGSGGGVVSGVFLGPAAFTQGSSRVLVEGQPAVALGAATAQNGVSANCRGAVLTPSQTRVALRR